MRIGELRIGELSRRVGVSTELLRAWERRYGVLRPARSDGGFRLYSGDDERRVRLMQQHLGRGLSAAEAAGAALAEDASNGSAVRPGDDARVLVEALERFDEQAAHLAFDRLLGSLAVETVLSRVVVPYLGALSPRWQRGEVTIAQEHFASNLLRGRLSRRPGLTGWRSTQRWSRSGSVESEQRVLATRPVVAASAEGAALLGERYWDEVERLARGLVRVGRPDGRVEVRLLRRGPRLLVLGPAELDAVNDEVVCRHAIVGGLLVRRPGGALTLSQSGRGEAELRSTITGFFPSLARGPGWSGSLYGHVQSRIHVLVSRRYFRRLTHGARP